MSPLVRRTLVSVLVVGALSLTLFAAPAQAAGARASLSQDTPTWSVFSLDFWMDFARSLFGVEPGGVDPVADSEQGQLGTVHDRAIFQLDPDGVYANNLVPGDSENLLSGQQ